MTRNKLIVITGPVGGGKSTAAIELGRCLRRRGQTTAVVDVDDMYIMGRQKSDDSWNEPETWSSARRACGALAESYFASGYDVFVVEGGDMRTNEQWDELRAPIQRNIEISFFTLVVSWEESFGRAKADPNRNITTDVGHRKMYKTYLSYLPALKSVSEFIDADDLVPEQVADIIANSALASSPHRGNPFG